jgi:hypothetical protein
MKKQKPFDIHIHYDPQSKMVSLKTEGPDGFVYAVYLKQAFTAAIQAVEEREKQGGRGASEVIQ